MGVNCYDELGRFLAQKKFLRPVCKGESYNQDLFLAHVDAFVLALLQFFYFYLRALLNSMRMVLRA